MSELPAGSIELLSSQLYFSSHSSPFSLRSSSSLSFVCVDNDLVYEPFLADFGPVNLSNTVKFCQLIERELRTKSRLCIVTSATDPHKRANAAYMSISFLVIVMRIGAEEAYRIFSALPPPALVPFRDAAFGPCLYDLHIGHCAKGLEKAISVGFFNYASFDVEEYDFYEKAENGDMNWIVPKKLLALSGPAASHFMDTDGIRNHTPEDYIPYFRKHKVNTVIRLNKKLYDRKRFVDAGIKHYDLYFIDGGTPTEPIWRRFLEICDTHDGAIAIHCKAGLGRTGTLIAFYLMRNYHFTAHEAIAWIRIARPGSIIGPQQQFVVDHQNLMWKEGAALHGSMGASPHSSPSVAAAGLGAGHHGNSSASINSNSSYSSSMLQQQQQQQQQSQQQHAMRSPQRGPSSPTYSTPSASSPSRVMGASASSSSVAGSPTGSYGRVVGQRSVAGAGYSQPSRQPALGSPSLSSSYTQQSTTSTTRGAIRNPAPEEYRRVTRSMGHH